MGKIKWGLILLVALIVTAFFHYTLPQRDIVRIVGTEVIRMDVDRGWFWAQKDVGTSANATRDVRFVNAVYENGKTMEFRNEDTGWGWPPYFKFDSGRIQAEAQLHSGGNTDVWVAVRHYGWRNEYFSIYPNVTSMKVVDGPNVSLIPWFNIIFLTLLFLTAFAIFRRLQRWKDRRIDPVLEGIGDRFDDVSDNVSHTGGRVSRWLGTWRSKKR